MEACLEGLTDKLAKSTLQRVHSILKRAIRQAQAHDKVGRNVAELVKTPKGCTGRPSKALTLHQAEAARPTSLHAYVVLSLLTGVRTEEARALRWPHVVAWVEGAGWRPGIEVGFDHERFAVYVWRSVRAHGDTKTEESRRTLELPLEVVEALRAHHARQAASKARRVRAGKAWHGSDLVFCTRNGTELDAAHVRRSFRAITQ